MEQRCAPATSSYRGGVRADFHIDRNGAWYYRGSAVRREGMVRLFASMLRKRDKGYVLQTPEQELRVSVEDAPLLIVDMEQSGQGAGTQLLMITSTGERFALGDEYPLFLREDAQSAELRAYQMTRDGLPALVHRNVFYRLADLAVTAPDGAGMGVFSGGSFFSLE